MTRALAAELEETMSAIQISQPAWTDEAVLHWIAYVYMGGLPWCTRLKLAWVVVFKG